MQNEVTRVPAPKPSQINSDGDRGEDLIWVISQIVAAVITLGLMFLLFRETAGGTTSTFPARMAGLLGFCAALYWLMSWHSRGDTNS
jgi:hypothetical protein